MYNAAAKGDKGFEEREFVMSNYMATKFAQSSFDCKFVISIALGLRSLLQDDPRHSAAARTRVPRIAEP